MRERSWDTFSIQANQLVRIPDWVNNRNNSTIMYSTHSRLGEGIDAGVVLERDKHCVFLKDENKVLNECRWYDLYVMYDGNNGHIKLRDFEIVIDGKNYTALVQPGCGNYFYNNFTAEDNADQFLYGYKNYYKYYEVLDNGFHNLMDYCDFNKITNFRDWLIKEFEEDMKVCGPSELEQEYHCVEVPFNA